MSEPWYNEFNSAFWLTLSASVLGFMGLCLQAILKSRCKTCKCCGVVIERDVAPPGQEPVLDLSTMERGRTASTISPPTPDSPPAPQKINNV